MQQAQENLSDLASESDSSNVEPLKRRPGRPKGSKTRRHVQVEVAKPQCKRCQSTDMQVLRKMNEMVHVGTHEGKPYNRITWHRVQCRSCRWVQVHKVWHND